MSARFYNNRDHSEVRGPAVATKEEAMVAKKILRGGEASENGVIRHSGMKHSHAA